MKIEPYLFFQGRCEEALNFYQRVFDSKQIGLMRFRESPEPPPMPLPPGWEEKIMHASLEIGETVLMASDGCGAEAPRFEGFSLCVRCPMPKPLPGYSISWHRAGRCRCPSIRLSFPPASAWSPTASE